MTRFQWREPNQRKQFIAILRSFHKEISKEFDLPDLSSDEMAFRLYLATGGVMGYVSKLFRQVLRNAVGYNGRPTITLKDLHVAHMQAIWSAQRIPDLPMPFEAGFQSSPTPEILDRVSRIGTAPAGVAVAQRRASNIRREQNLNDILSAK